MTLKHATSCVFQRFILSLRKPVDVCTVLTILLKYKRDNARKAVPLQAWRGPDGSRKLRFPDFVTTAQDVGKVVSLTHRLPLPPGNTPGTHFF